MGIRAVHGRHAVTMPWPRRADHPAYGATLRRDHLDQYLRDQAVAAGATVLMGHEASAPIVERGFVRGAELEGDRPAVHARFVVVADGANSTFGRALGTTRQRQWPYGITTRTYFESPRHAESWLETELAIAGPNGDPVTGYGWVAPLRDGTVNVGVAVSSTYREARAVHVLKLLDAFAADIAARWQIDPTAPLKAPTRFRVPVGGSVGPKMGPTFLLAGDAAGMASPLNGDGVDAALMTGRLAADVLHEALTSGNSTALQRYPGLVAAEVGEHHRVARLALRFLGRPLVLRAALRAGLGSERVAGAALRVATNELRADDPAGAERAYAVARAISKLAPAW